ncbi:MAG: lipid-A-disaccharide synthase [Candidatus Omnitrophica bacterium]|nr:lipid-A-disaccharide synthase [Candidatus Omnitrophota bacterium]
MKQPFFLVAGEHSGDQRGADLITALRKLDPSISFTGLGGHLMEAAGCTIIFNLPSIAALGFTDVIRQYGKFQKVFSQALNAVDRLKPAAVILIDFPGFNIRLAKKIKKRFPVIYYVSPQIWAWAPFRKYTIARSVHKMLTLFKFEREAYRGTGLDVEWVGHPLIDQINRNLKASEIRARYGVSEKETVIGLLPGSREKEVTRVLPVMLDAGKIIAESRPKTVFFVSCSGTVKKPVFDKILADFSGLKIVRVNGGSQELLTAADFSLVCSGTATLEAAILQAPFLLIYKTAYLTYLFARNLMQIPFIGMANVLAKRMIIPEFIQHKARPEAIAQRALFYLNNPESIQKMKRDLKSVLGELGDGRAADRAAGAIFKFVQTTAGSFSGTFLTR